MTPHQANELLVDGRSVGIGLPCGRTVTFGAYARAWRAVKAMPPNRLVAGWDHFPVPAGDVLRDIRRGVMDRASRGMTFFGDDDTYWRMHRLASTLNGTRVIVGTAEIPPRYRARLAHRTREVLCD